MPKKNQVAGKVGQDPTLPNVSLILNGVERHLAFDFNAIVQVELLTGINLLKSAITELSATNVRALLWASLLKENPDLTVEEVGGWITMHNVVLIQQAVITAWFGSAEESDGKVADSGE